MNKELILFDFDGVIVSSFDFAYEIYKGNKPGLTMDSFKEMFEGNFHEHGSYTKISKEQLDKEHEVFFNLYGTELIKRFPIKGMDEIIRELSPKHILYIITSGQGRAVEIFLKQHNLLQCFKKVMGIEIDKSKVKKIQLVLADEACDPKDCLFITDTLGDIMEAKSCGVDSLAVTWGYHTKETLLKGEPLAFFDSPEEIKQYFIE